MMKVSAIVDESVARPLPEHVRGESCRKADKRDGHEGSIELNVKTQHARIYGRIMQRRVEDGLGYAEEGADGACQVAEG